jgi:hypothetical protein
MHAEDFLPSKTLNSIIQNGEEKNKKRKMEEF